VDACGVVPVPGTWLHDHVQLRRHDPHLPAP
jgi:hypothetical protein